MDRAALKLVDFSHLASGAESAPVGERFPYGLGRTGVHEVCARAYGDGPAATGFALAAGLAEAKTGAVAFISLIQKARDGGQLCARGLASLGARPERFFHIEARKPGEALWAVEEAVTSSAVACVVAECADLDFTASRRLALASQARGTPVILLLDHRRSGPTAAQGRWRIETRLSAPNRLNARGLGRARWDAQLERSRTAPEAIGRRHTLEFDDATLSLHLAGELAPRQASPRSPQTPAAYPIETGLRRTG
ncbi:MAG: hypothetical protein AAF829_04915 [Pseudomonadota bacterium]